MGLPGITETQTAERTLDRIEAFDDPANEYAQMAHDQYGEMSFTYREAVITALDSLEESETESTT